MLVSAKGLSLSFGEESIFKGLGFEIKEGEKVGLSGPSGSGKSSLLRLLLGFESANEGSIQYGSLRGKQLGDIQGYRKATAYLPQELVFPFLESKDLLEYIWEVTGTLKSEGRLALDTILSKINMDAALVDKPLASLSGGQKQRLILAGILSTEKPILMLDEPSSALDAENDKLLRHLVLRDFPGTVIFTSHNPLWLEEANSVIEL